MFSFPDVLNYQVSKGGFSLQFSLIEKNANDSQKPKLSEAKSQPNPDQLILYSQRKKIPKPTILAESSTNSLSVLSSPSVSLSERQLFSRSKHHREAVQASDEKMTSKETPSLQPPKNIEKHSPRSQHHNQVEPQISLKERYSHLFKEINTEEPKIPDAPKPKISRHSSHTNFKDNFEYFKKQNPQFEFSSNTLKYEAKLSFDDMIHPPNPGGSPKKQCLSKTLESKSSIRRESNQVKKGIGRPPQFESSVENSNFSSTFATDYSSIDPDSVATNSSFLMSISKELKSVSSSFSSSNESFF